MVPSHVPYWRSGIDWIIISSFYLFLIIDDLNGFFAGVGLNIPVSIIWKTLLSIILIGRLIPFKIGRIVVCSSFLFIAVIILVQSLCTEPKPGDSVNHIFRFIFLVYIYTYLYLNIGLCNIYIKLIRILNFNTYVLIANILLILIGLGFSNYSDEGVTTTKGFFYAGNELSGLFILLCPIFLFHVATHGSTDKMKFWLSFLTITVASFLLGSKTAIVGTLVLNIIVIKKYLSKQGQAWLFYCGIIIIFIFTVIQGVQLVEQWDLWQRWSYFYESGGIEKVIFSDRDVYWTEEKSEIIDGGLLYILLGLGGNRTVEMDIHDTFLNYGVLGLVIVYGFYFFIIKKVYALRKEQDLARLVFVVDIFFLFFSCFAGHMIFSGMAAPFVAIVNILPLALFKSKDVKSRKTYAQ